MSADAYLKHFEPNTERGRWLKDKYPCRGCSEPVPVRSRRDIEHATCVRCREIGRLASGANYHFRLAKRLYDENAEAHEDWADIVPPILEAAAEAMEAASFAVKAARLMLDARQRADWIRAARAWAKWSARTFGEIDQAMADLGTAGLRVIDGGVALTAPPEPSEAIKAHALVVHFGGRTS